MLTKSSRGLFNLGLYVLAIEEVSLNRTIMVLGFRAPETRIGMVLGGPKIHDSTIYGPAVP